MLPRVTTPTRGSKKLKELLAGHGKQRKFVALCAKKGLAIDEPTVSRWVRAERKPTREQMAKLEDIVGIPMRAWVEEAKGAA